MSAPTAMTMDAMVEKVRRLLGKPTDPVRFEVEKGTMVRYARDTGETNPLYLDEDAAKASRYGSLIASPTFVSWFLKGIVPDEIFDFDLPLETVLHTDDIVEMGVPIRPGDVITAVGELTDVFVRESKRGPMLFQTGDVTLTNQSGEFAGMVRTVSVLFAKQAAA